MSVGFSYGTLNNTLLVGLEKKQDQLAASINNTGRDIDGNITTLDMLRLQQQLQQFTLMTDLTSTMNKSYTDSVKSVVQKAS